MAVALADQSSHQVIKQGNAPAVSHAVHKAHGAYHSTVSSQPHAAPQDVHGYHNKEKYSAAVVAPAHIPVHKPAPYHPSPVHKPVHAPVYHPAPVYKPAPVYHPAPAYKPAPYVAPVVHKPAPAPYVAPVVHAPVHAPAYHAPAHHAPAYGKEPAYDGPAVYQYGYAVHDDYAKTDFQANENRDGYTTNGEYRVNLPDGRTQIVNYNVGDAYSGYVADVKYEGVAQYPEYHPTKPTYHPVKPAPYHA